MLVASFLQGEKADVGSEQYTTVTTPVVRVQGIYTVVLGVGKLVGGDGGLRGCSACTKDQHEALCIGGESLRRVGFFVDLLDCLENLSSVRARQAGSSLSVFHYPALKIGRVFLASGGIWWHGRRKCPIATAARRKYHRYKEDAYA